MKFLKGLALGLLSLLLFLSLPIFGIAFLLNQTILNPNFITSELDKLDVSSLAEELISEQIREGEFPEELGAALIDTITKLESPVKEQVNAATYSIFDYLLGKRENPDLALTLSNTLLSLDFIVSVVKKLDIPSLASEFLGEQLAAAEIPEELASLPAEAIDDTLVEMELWIEEQISTAADPIVDYLLGESPSLSVVISLEPIIENLRNNMLQALLESPPPELAGLPTAIIEKQFDEFFQEFSEMIPATFEIDEALLGTEIPAQIAGALAEAEAALGQGREFVSSFQIAFKALIGFMLLLIAGIILMKREVKSSTRKLGIIFLTYGVIWYAGTSVAKHFVGAQLPALEMPSSLQAWLPQFINNFLAPLSMFSLGLLIGGVALIVVSFVYPRWRQTSS